MRLSNPRGRTALFASLSVIASCFGIVRAAPPAPAKVPPAAPPAVVTDAPGNKEWDVDATSATFTGGGRGPTTITIVLGKAAVSGRPVTVQSDGDNLVVDDGSTAVPVTLAVDRQGATAADGAVSVLLLVAGDRPTVSLNGHESVRENGHWRRLAHGAGAGVRLSVTNATFAVLKFPPPAVPVPPPPPPAVVSRVPGPRVPVAVEPVIKPAKLKALVQDFVAAVGKPCPYCHGTGHLVRQVQVGSHLSGILRVPDMQDQTVNCTHCDHGVVRATPDVVLHRTANLVRGLIAVDRADGDTQAVLKGSYDLITANAIGDNRAWEILTRDARSTLSVARPQLGTALIAEVFVDQAWTDGQGRRMFRAHLPGTTNRFVIVNPPTADNVATGPVLMGGLVDGQLTTAKDAGTDGELLTAVGGAFVLAPDIDRRWTWWAYRDAYRSQP